MSIPSALCLFLLICLIGRVEVNKVHLLDIFFGVNSEKGFVSKMKVMIQRYRRRGVCCERAGSCVYQ